jgi:hypothetical protein
MPALARAFAHDALKPSEVHEVPSPVAKMVNEGRLGRVSGLTTSAAVRFGLTASSAALRGLRRGRGRDNHLWTAEVECGYRHMRTREGEEGLLAVVPSRVQATMPNAGARERG